MNRPLVRFVQHQQGIASQVIVGQVFSHEHTVGHVFDNGLWRRHIVKSNRVSHFFAQSTAVFFRHAFGNGYGGHTTRLRTTNHALFGQTQFHAILRDLRRFSRTRFPNHRQDLIFRNGLHQFLLESIHGQGLSLFLNGFGRNDTVRQRLVLHLGFPFRNASIIFHIGRHVDASQFLRKMPLPRFRQGIFPRFVHILGNRINRLLLLRFAQFPSFLGIGHLLEGRALQRAVGVLDNLDRFQLSSRPTRLSAQKGGFRIGQFDFGFLFGFFHGQHAHATVGVKRGILLHRQDARSNEQLGLP
mmetsp:Transcript_31592/g.74016  ORF Transcript_31592/g.74016 Transcript_31592/m.74016 type:complete len:300 (-) Transcript_31592:118-1017(-)